MPDPAARSDEATSIQPFGDAALLITLGTRFDAALAARAQAVAAALDAARPGSPALGRPVAAHASVLLPFDPLAIGLEDAIEIAHRSIAGLTGTARLEAPEGAAAIEIAVRYGGSDGPDLEAVADLHGLRPADVIELHAGATYRVLFLGFAPGFGYLRGLPTELATPRRASPRERVPAGSVGIAGEQTGVYPLAMPGGWQLIGRTDAVLFDPERDPAALFSPGATIRFVPVQVRIA